MSWLVQTLLRNSIRIKGKHDLDADEYNDLLVIESKVKSLHEDNIISDEEIRLIGYVEDGKPLLNSKQGYGKNRLVVARDFSELCSKIAFYAGGYFTDDGYVDYMRKKYPNLTDDNIDDMLAYMKSRYKNTLIRKPKKSNE